MKEKIQKNDYILLILSIVILTLIFLVSKDGLISYISTITGIICTYLIIKKKILNYLFGIISIIFYGISCYQVGYSGDLVLYIGILLPLQFVGIYNWNINYDQKKEEIIIMPLTKSNKIKTIYGSILLYLTIYLTIPYLNKILNVETNPLMTIDALTTTLAIIGMIYQVLKYKQQWIIWIIVDIFSILMWLYYDNYLIVTMYIVYLLNGLYGYYNWRKIK